MPSRRRECSCPAANLGFVIATPAGLTLAAGVPAAAALPLGGPRGDLALRHAGLLRGAVVAVVAWGAASILGVPGFMAEAAPAEVAPPLRLGALRAVVLYAYAAWHFLRLLALAGPTAAARRRRRPRPPRRGDGDRRLQPRLASLVVGVAPPDGDRLRRGRVRGADPVPTRGLADGCVRRALPVRDPRAAASMACRSPLRPRFGARRGSARWTASSTASASTARRPKSSPCSSAPELSCDASTSSSGRTFRNSSSTGRGPIPGRRASGAARSAR